MKRLFWGILACIVAVCVPLSAQAGGAGSEGFDLRVALSGVSLIANYTSDFDAIDNLKDEFGGIMGELEFGYRWQYVGLYYEQDLGGVWFTSDNNPDYADDDSWFVGGSYFVVRGMYAFAQKCEVELTFGIGAMYGNGDKLEEMGKPGYLFPLIVSDDMNPAAAFALRLQAGLNYYFSDRIGAGIHFHYSVAFKHHNFNDGGGNKAAYEYTKLLHKIDPGAQLVIRF